MERQDAQQQRNNRNSMRTKKKAYLLLSHYPNKLMKLKSIQMINLNQRNVLNKLKFNKPRVLLQLLGTRTETKIKPTLQSRNILATYMH